LYESNADVKPIIVTTELELIDGRHRVEALRRLGRVHVKAFIAKTRNKIENIMESVRANAGGALPPTQQDFEHAIELLINQGMKKHEVVDQFPLPKKVTDKYYTAVMNKIYKRKVGRAIEEIIKGEMTVLAAAEKYKVKPEDLRDMIANRKERGINVPAAMGNMETRVRGLSAAITKQASMLVAKYADAEVDAEDMKRYADRVRDSGRRILATTENVVARIHDTIAVKSANIDVPHEEEEEKGAAGNGD
jgi:hypothetical protein